MNPIGTVRNGGSAGHPGRQPDGPGCARGGPERPGGIIGPFERATA